MDIVSEASSATVEASWSSATPGKEAETSAGGSRRLMCAVSSSRAARRRSHSAASASASARRRVSSRGSPADAIASERRRARRAARFGQFHNWQTGAFPQFPSVRDSRKSARNKAHADFRNPSHSSDVQPRGDDRPRRPSRPRARRPPCSSELVLPGAVRAREPRPTLFPVVLARATSVEIRDVTRDGHRFRFPDR